MCSVTIRDRTTNEEIRILLGMLSNLLCRMEKWALKWFSNVERMDGGWIAQNIYDSGSEGRKRKTNRGLDR